MPIKYVKYHEVKVGVTYKFIDKGTGEYRYITAVNKSSGNVIIGFHCCKTPIQSQSMYRELPKYLGNCSYMCTEDYFNNLGVTTIGDPIREVWTPQELEKGVVYKVINPINSTYIKTNNNTTRYYQEKAGWRITTADAVKFLHRSSVYPPALLEVADIYPSLPEELK